MEGQLSMQDFEELEEDTLYTIKLDYVCPYGWNNMWGDDRIRFCGACEKNVYNISQLSKKDALALIARKEGDLCVTFYQRRDGTVVTQDCLSILGTQTLREKYNILSLINAGLSAMALTLMPMLGPALCTIVSGVGPIMSSTKSDYKSVVQPDDVTTPLVQFDAAGNVIDSSGTIAKLNRTN